MSEISPTLFLGGIGEASQKRWLKTNAITHILTVQDDPIEEYAGMKHLYIQAMDIESEDLLSHFDKAFEFLYECEESENGKALVHCQMGMSRSVTIVCAYLMRKHLMGFKEALERVREKRTIACPNAGFRKQLHLYEYMEFRISPDHSLYRQYLLQSKRPGVRSRYFDLCAYLENPPPPPDDGVYVFKCRMCRTVLFESSQLIKHAVGENTDALQQACEGFGSSKVCTEGHYVLPVRWMQKEVEEVSSGKLNCPNEKCKKKIGTFNWAGMQCGCKAWITPGFHVQSVKVDQERVNTTNSSSESASSSS